MERCKGRCEVCGQPPDWRGLAVSHTIPKGMGGTRRVYLDSDLQVLCSRCHSGMHHLREG
jgi:5-methylcytosine-specific restriction endonuclease McrA